MGMFSMLGFVSVLEVFNLRANRRAGLYTAALNNAARGGLSRRCGMHPAPINPTCRVNNNRL